MQQPRSSTYGRTCHVAGAISIDRKCSLRLPLSLIYERVCCSVHHQRSTRLGDRSVDVRGTRDVTLRTRNRYDLPASAR